MKNYLAIFLVVLALFLTVFLLNNQITGFIVLDEDNVNFNLFIQIFNFLILIFILFSILYIYSRLYF